MFFCGSVVYSGCDQRRQSSKPLESGSTSYVWSVGRSLAHQLRDMRGSDVFGCYFMLDLTKFSLFHEVSLYCWTPDHRSWRRRLCYAQWWRKESLSWALSTVHVIHRVSFFYFCLCLFSVFFIIYGVLCVRFDYTNMNHEVTGWCVGLYSASVVENPLVMAGLLLAAFVVLMLLVAIAYFVIKSVSFPPLFTPPDSDC